MSGILWDSNDAAYATGGKNTCDWVAYGVSIDTRTLNQGDIFYFKGFGAGVPSLPIVFM